MKHRIIGGVLAFLLCAGPAAACGIKDWRILENTRPDILVIEGLATCSYGRITMYFYEGDGVGGQRFLGTASGNISTYAFHAFGFDIRIREPDATTMRYVVHHL